jgi:abortive infection Abi-like protein
VPSPNFWTESEVPSPWTSFPDVKISLNTELVESLRAQPLPDVSDVVSAERLLDLVWGELEGYGTDGSNVCDDREIATAIRALEAVAKRLGVSLELPFRDFSRFRSYWLRHDGYGSWQARRDIIEELLEPARKELETLESRLAGPRIKEELISNLRNPAAIREQLGRLQRTAESDPALAIGTAKELIESTAKTVLLERGLNVNDKDDLPALVKQAQEALGLHPATAGPGPDGTDAVKRILGGLTSVAAGLGELRNRGYGTGHGQKGERVGLRPRHARLAVNAAMTWCNIILDTLADSEAPWKSGEGQK